MREGWLNVVLQLKITFSASAPSDRAWGKCVSTILYVGMHQAVVSKEPAPEPKAPKPAPRL